MTIRRLKKWIGAMGGMVLLLGAGIYFKAASRTELTPPQLHSIDPALIQYQEVTPILPTLRTLSALAVAPNGTLYVGGDQAIEEIGATTIPMVGTPTCLAVDDAGSLFVGLSNHVEVFSKDWKRQVWSSPSENAFLTSVAVDEWYVYVADAGNARIWRYHKKGGKKPLEIGRKDWVNGVHGFKLTQQGFDVAIHRMDGSIWVINPGYHAFENYRPDGMPLSSWAFAGASPSHWARLPDGGWVTVEIGAARIKVYNEDGSPRGVVARSDQFDTNPAGMDVAVGSKGQIYVLDSNRNQVRVFKKKKRVTVERSN
jgi:DNA-binding beta-propeller fold protein YncE